MYSVKFKVHLIEPIIVSAKDKTETGLNCLDYIPGNIFLGMAAGKLYRPNKNNHQEILDYFHNGNVQFGNAYLAINNIQSKPIPANWYKEKGKSVKDKLYLYHTLTNADWKDFAKDGKQIKQERNGYFIKNTDGKYIIANVEKGVVLKSAYDSDRRSAKNKQMYLYEYIEAGQDFIFEVRSTEEKYLIELVTTFKGNKHISKSKTAEFGKVKFSKIGEIGEIDIQVDADKQQYVVYAQSNLAFINEYGEFTWQPTAEDLGFENAEINYQLSQLYFDKIHLRNGKRRTHDSDRLLIKKGSVFVIEEQKNKTISVKNDLINKGVGVFLSEGYGRLVINPAFLQGEIKFKDNSDTTDNNSITYDTESEFYKIFTERKDLEDKQKDIYTAVSNFVNNHKSTYKSISKSQWGAIRSLIYQARQTNNPNEAVYDLIFKYVDSNEETQTNKSGYIYHGRMGEKWVGNKRRFLREALEITNTSTEVTDLNIEKLLLLTIQMPKN